MRALLILAIAAPALADAPKAKPLSAADQKAYVAQLRKGRQLQGKKDYAGAIAAFQACVKIEPGDGTCLGELGWTAYLAKDLALAESATKDALHATGSPALRGATLYNFGLILEAKGDKPGAIGAYSASLVARPNGVVRATLAKLSPDAAAAFDPFKPRKMYGPFATIDAYCATTPKTVDDADCHCFANGTKDAKKALPPGVLEVETFLHACSAGQSGVVDYGIAVKVASGWYATNLATVDQNRFCQDYSRLTDVTASPSKAAIARFDIGGECAGGNGGNQWRERGLVVVGGEKPSATDLLVAMRHETDSDEPYNADKVSKVTVDIALDFKWDADGSVTVSGKTKGLDSSAASDVLGKHALAFP